MLAFLAALSIPTLITLGPIEKMQKPGSGLIASKTKSQHRSKNRVRALVVSKDQ
jgi:hypothetical protein